MLLNKLQINVGIKNKPVNLPQKLCSNLTISHSSNNDILDSTLGYGRGKIAQAAFLVKREGMVVVPSLPPSSPALRILPHLKESFSNLLLTKFVFKCDFNGKMLHLFLRIVPLE